MKKDRKSKSYSSLKDLIASCGAIAYIDHHELAWRLHPRNQRS
ncbi:hypothetical protein [Pseudanabaena sp. SR411]|nr:hypothetical protein [Pseudanabaena sp. SR411]